MNSRLFSILTNALLLTVLIWAGISSGRAGLARLFVEYSSISNSLSASERALNYNPSDPEAHYTRALQLSDAGQLADAITELERATTLRPADYFLWQELGRLREENGDTEGAIKALQNATTLAPYYSQPHWQLGNVLLRTEQPQAGFAEMRRAATSNPELFPALIDLAFGVYEGDVTLINGAVEVQNDHERTLLIDFFLKHNCRDAAVELVRSMKNLDNVDRQRVVSSLVATEDFKLAYELWLNGRSTVDQLFDGGFESPISAGDGDFGWQSTKLTQTVKLLLDTDRPQSGGRSLRVDYGGNFDENTPVISQLVPVEPNLRYQVSFSSRSENLFSAGSPIVAISDASGEHGILGASPTLASGSRGWSNSSFVFQSKENTKAIRLNIQRTPCNVKPCPITGKAWFDGFSLTKLQ
jgi:tetratricopeptide (TPR) repeat protein